MSTLREHTLHTCGRSCGDQISISTEEIR
jgi:hypothetical protein